MERTLKYLKEILGADASKVVTTSSNHPYQVGNNYLIRTITMIYTGKLESVGDQELVISSAAWIAETDRWATCLKEGSFKEVEPYPTNQNVIIGRGAILDATIWQHELPDYQK